MTICVAALCDDGQSCVVAADRMAVFGGGSLLEFKLDDKAKKIHRISDKALLLHSGRSQDAETIVSKLTRDQSVENVPEIIDVIVTEELQRRRDRMAARLLGTDVTYEKLTNTVASGGGPLHDIWQQVRKDDFGEILVVARDDSGCSIHAISPPSLPFRADLDYATVGSGRIYALAALTIQLYSKDRKVSEALFQVYAAKKAAELVYGVGEPTDMAVVTEGGITDCPPETLALLEEYRLEKFRYLLTETESSAIRDSLNL